MDAKYKDMLRMQRPESHRQRMAFSDRAKIFSPFAALRGYEKIIQSKEQMRVNRRYLSEEEGDEINRKLIALKKGDRISVTSFHADPGCDGSGGMAEGTYQTISGVVSKIDMDTGVMWIDGIDVSIGSISRLDYGQFPLSEENGTYEKRKDFIYEDLCIWSQQQSD